MAERLQWIDEEDVLLPADYPDEDELPTNRLKSGNLADRHSAAEEVDWLLKLRTKNLSTQHLPADPLRFVPRPSGMAAHTTPVRIVPTIGARLRTGLRRGTLLIVLAALAVGALGGGAYLLASTSWLSNYNLPAPPPASVAEQGQHPANSQPSTLPASDPSSSPGQALGGNQGTTGGSTSAPPPGTVSGPTGQSGSPSAEASVMSGLDARNLRDQGVTAYQQGKYADAITDLEASISISSDDPVAQYQLGLAYMASQGREHALDDAELAFRTAISLEPGWAAPYQMLAETLMRRGYYEQAVPLALQATQIDPTTGDLWLTLGRAYSGAGREAEATRAFAQATKYAPPPPQP